MLPFVKNRIGHIMDYIRLDRVQPFASPPETTTSSVKTVSPLPPPAVESNHQQQQIPLMRMVPPQDTPMPFASAQQTQPPLMRFATPEEIQPPLMRFAPPQQTQPPLMRFATPQYTQTQLNAMPNQPLSIQAPPPIEIDLAKLQSKANEVNGLSFRRYCNNITPPVPIFNDVIPLFADTAAVIDYQRVFTQDPSIVDNITIAEALRPFNWPAKKNRYTMSVKLYFLSQFLMKLHKCKVNFDFAVTCHDKETEEELFCVLSGAIQHYGERGEPEEGKPATLRTRLSSYSPSSNLFGIMYKHRKNANDIKHTFKSSLDLIMVYSSACNVDDERIFDVFQGTHAPRPSLVYLCVSDSPDIRIHHYNSVQATKNLIRWDTKVGDLSDFERQKLLYQPNRILNGTRAANDLSGWVDATSQNVINWIKMDMKKCKYKISLTTRGRMGEVFKMFEHHHPKTPIPRSEPEEIMVGPMNSTPQPVRFVQSSSPKKPSPRSSNTPSPSSSSKTSSKKSKKKKKNKEPSPPKIVLKTESKQAPADKLNQMPPSTAAAATTMHPERLNHLKRPLDASPNMNNAKRPATGASPAKPNPPNLTFIPMKVNPPVPVKKNPPPPVKKNPPPAAKKNPPAPVKINQPSNSKRARAENGFHDYSSNKRVRQEGNDYIPDFSRLSGATTTGYVHSPSKSEYVIERTPVASLPSSSSGSPRSVDRSYPRSVASTSGGGLHSVASNRSSVLIIDDPIDFSAQPEVNTVTSTNHTSTTEVNTSDATKITTNTSKADSDFVALVPPPSATISDNQLAHPTDTSSDKSDKAPVTSSTNVDDMFAEALKQFEREMQALNAKFK